MKLSFSIPKKSQTKPPSAAIRGGDDETEQSRVYLKEFDGSKAPETNPIKTRIIAPKANEWRPEKRMKNLDLSVSGAGDNPALQFEVIPASLADVAASDTMSYGLNLRNPESNPNPKSNPSTDPMLKKLREDLQNLPDESTMEDFENMPVEDFSRALMAGYGWVEGRGIGRNAKEDVKIYQYSKHTGKGGLGFKDSPLEADKASDQVQRGKIDEAAVSNGKVEIGFQVGDEVTVIAGKEIGMKGRVLELRNKGKVAILKLFDSRKVVKVDVRDLAELKVRENGVAKHPERENGEENSRSSRFLKNGRKRDGEENGRDSRVLMNERKRERERDEPKPWLTSHIRVRIISKSMKGGKLYLKKGKVVDMIGPTTCDLTMDESKELIQGVEQGQLETAIPKRGGPVLVLSGRHKGIYGSLVERDTRKETCVVRDADTHEMISVGLEQIAEYVGDPSYIGY